MKLSRDVERKVLDMAAETKRAEAPYKPVQTLTILGWQPTRLNVLLRTDKYRRARLLARDAEIIGVEARLQCITPATGKRRVSLVIIHKPGVKPPDVDALQKSLLDACVKAGLIVDDSGEWCEIGSVTYEAGLRKGIVVVLEDRP